MRTCLLVMAAAIVAASPAAARRTDVNVVMPCKPEARKRLETAGYASAVIARGMIYLSGVASAPRAGEADLEPSFTRIFDSITRTLAQVGATWDDVVDVTSYHTDIDAQMQTFDRVARRYVNSPFPTSTVIGVSRLIVPEAIAEIKVVAELPENASNTCR